MHRETFIITDRRTNPVLGSIDAAIQHEDEMKIRIVLSSKALDRACDQDFFVVCGNDDGDLRPTFGRGLDAAPLGHRDRHCAAHDPIATRR